MVNNIVYQFVGSNLEVEILLKKREHQRVHWNKRLRFLCTLYWGFKKIPFTLYTYVLAKILQNGAKFLQKLTPGFQNQMRNLNNFRQAVESPRSWKKFDGVLLSKKYIPSAKTLYAGDLTTFNYLCGNSPNFLCHFWNHKSFFTAQLLCIF